PDFDFFPAPLPLLIEIRIYILSPIQKGRPCCLHPFWGILCLFSEPERRTCMTSRVLGGVGGMTLALGAMMLLPATISAEAVLFSAAGGDPASIQTGVDAYRSALGTLNPNVPGSFGSGRREINWDGVPDNLAAPNNLPPNFFNVNSPRGVVFSTPGTGFQVSANDGVAPVRFGNINPTYPNTFQTFSPQRLFAPLGSNLTNVDFFIPGSTDR